MKGKTLEPRNVRSHILGVPLNLKEQEAIEKLAKKKGLTKAGFARMILMREIAESE